MYFFSSFSNSYVSILQMLNFSVDSKVRDIFIQPCFSDLKADATWEVDGTGSPTGVPFSMYLLSGLSSFFLFFFWV